jgi:hypothetical protein
MHAMARNRSGWLMATLVAMALAASPGVATARAAGAHRLTDSQATPGATCVYDGAGSNSPLVSIKVRPPQLWAQDRRPGKVDRQMVGWRYVVESSSDGFEWDQVDVGPLVTATATDRVKASFAPQTWKADGVDYHMRVRIDTYWFRGGEVAASLRMTPVWYAYQPFNYTFAAGCSS